MQDIWILLLAVQFMCSCASITHHVEMMYGDSLSIILSMGAVKLQFVPVDETEPKVLWAKYQSAKRGIVTGRDNGRRFVINSITFDDQGTYTVLNVLKNKMSIHLLKVVAKKISQDCVAGETFQIPLGYLVKNDAMLHFSNEDYNLTLVDHGLPVGNLNPEYMGRIQVTSNSIEVLNVNVSDVGNYTLSDRLNRKVKIISMYLVAQHQGISAGPLTALLLLLGIPPCICCCFRNKNCKKRRQPTTNTTVVKFDNQVNPPGPPPAYVNPQAPAGPPPGYTPPYPAVGESIVHPPPNPIFPPQPPCSGYPATSPAMPPIPDFNPECSNQNPLYPPASSFPPAQPPQWSDAPYNRPAPAGFAPVMYNGPAGPEPVKGEITATTPLLMPPQAEVAQNPAPYTATDVLNSSGSTVQFNTNKGIDSSSNFL